MDFKLNTKEIAELPTDVGIFSRNDAPAAFCGAGSGSLCWFNDYVEMAEFVRGFLLHECLLTQFEESENPKVIEFIEQIAENLESESRDLEKCIRHYNKAFKGIDQIEWIGTFDQLCISNGSWESSVREFVNDDGDIISSNNRMAFAEAIMTYGC